MEETSMNIKIRKLVRMTATIGMFMALGLTAPAQAEDVHCTTFDGLRTALDYLIFTNPTKDKTALLSKITEAELKDGVIGTSKNCDASQKLREFRDKMTKLVVAKKPKVSDPYDPATFYCLDHGTELMIRAWDPSWTRDTRADEATLNCPVKPKGPRGLKN